MAPTFSYAATPTYQIEVNKTTNKLYLFKDGAVYKVYPVATGKLPSYTPEGTFYIKVKMVNPSWKGIPGGTPQNPLGPRWNGLSVHGDSGHTYGIHGTNHPESIGTHASHGCIRMYNKDVIELYNIVPIGTPVWIHSGKSDNVWHGNSKVGNGSSASYKVTPATGKVRITGSLVNLRTGPSTSYPVVQTVKSGTTLTLTGIAGSWYQVKSPSGKTVYVINRYSRAI